MKRIVNNGAAWVPPPYDDDDAYAVKAVHAGVASEAQQKRALNYILHALCAVSDWSFRPDNLGGSRATDIMLGRQFVGLQIWKLINLPPRPNKEGSQ